MLKIFGGASRLLSLLSLQDISFCDRASVVSGERQERLQIQWLSEARCQLGIGLTESQQLIEILECHKIHRQRSFLGQPSNP